MAYVIDLETGDPNGILALLFAIASTRVKLIAVTLSPGTNEQVSLVRWILNHFDCNDVRIGAREWPNNANKIGYVSDKFYSKFGRSSDLSCDPADKVLLECCNEEVTLVTCAPFFNLEKALMNPVFKVGRLVAQGGFVSCNVIPATQERQHLKFLNKDVGRTDNFYRNTTGTKEVLESNRIGRRILVSENVCYSTNYDVTFHTRLRFFWSSTSKSLLRTSDCGYKQGKVILIMD